MAQELSDLIGSPTELASRSAAGIAFTSTFPVEEEVGRHIESLLLKRAELWAVDDEPSSMSAA
jgi:hypothetical protein